MLFRHQMKGATATKRKAAATARDGKLQRVVQALDNVTRIGATFATRSSDRFPLPAIAFKGDHGDGGEELLLPLRKDEALEIKTRGTVSQHLDGVATAWEVGGGALEFHNPRWHEFLDECLTNMRDALGIAPTASVELSLSKLRIVESGAMLHVQGNQEERAQRDGVFGTLLVVLPSAFGGGTIVFEDDDESEGEAEDDEAYLEEMAAMREELTWRPSARRTPYDLSFAAIYDRCSYDAEPVTSGAALCLVYDLVTTTPGDVPLYAGTSVIHNLVNEALTDYFDVAPPTLAKRCKIGPDAWRTINEFAAERHFVHIVRHDFFEDLEGDDMQIMHRLAAFCAQSGGQFVLYLARVLCYRTWRRRDGSSDDEHDEDDGPEVTRLKLIAPWVKYDTSVASDYPPIDVSCYRDVAPMGQVDQFRMESLEYLYDRSDCRLAEKLLGSGRDIKVCFSYALVVQPASIELRQIAKLPFEGVIETFNNMLPESHDEALEYARRVFFYRPEWHGSSWTDFPQLVDIVIKINDIELFRRLLGTVYVDARKSLRRGVAHFGWDACADRLIKRVVSTPTLRDRVNWVLSVIPRSAGPECIGSLLDVLLSLHPWTDVMVAAGQKTDSDEYLPSERQFQSLLALAHLSSQERLVKIATVTHAEEMVRLVAPALTSLVENYPTEPQLITALHHVWGILQMMMPDIRNERFVKIRISSHCDKCVELQSFLSSMETETILTNMSDQECNHIKAVIERAVVYPADVQVERMEAGTALQLVKRPGLGFDGLFNRAEREVKRMASLLHFN